MKLIRGFQVCEAARKYNNPRPPPREETAKIMDWACLAQVDWEESKDIFITYLQIQKLYPR